MGKLTDEGRKLTAVEVYMEIAQVMMELDRGNTSAASAQQSLRLLSLTAAPNLMLAVPTIEELQERCSQLRIGQPDATDYEESYVSSSC